MKNYKTDIFTGMRATSGITIGNLMGAIQPILNILDDGTYGRPMIFVADMHSLTSNEPQESQEHVVGIIKDYIAAGLDPKKVDLFIQSAIAPEVSTMTMYLSRLITVAELLRVPTLKDKIKNGQNEATANALLALYPVIMASDILLQGSHYVPVGKDQSAHLEVTCDLVNRFNKRYGEIFILPKPLVSGEPINILSLSGDGKKMSKTDPNNAILLDDAIEVSLKKIKKAPTAFAGETTPELENLTTIAEYVSDEDGREKIKEILDRHMKGEQVMGEFKGVLSDQLERFLSDFQSRKAKVSDEDVLDIVEKGAEVARSNAQEVLSEVEKAMGMRYV